MRCLMIMSSSFSKFLGHIVFEKQGFPSNLVERRRCHELLQPIIRSMYASPLMVGQTETNVS